MYGDHTAAAILKKFFIERGEHMDNKESIGYLICGACGKPNLKPAQSCRHCGSSRSRETTLSGKGALYSYTIIHVPPENWTFNKPYAVGLVSVDDGILVTALYEGIEFERLSPGAIVNLNNQNEVFKFELVEKN